MKDVAESRERKRKEGFLAEILPCEFLVRLRKEKRRPSCPMLKFLKAYSPGPGISMVSLARGEFSRGL